MITEIGARMRSTLQTEVTLSSTEAELVALSAAAREVIFIMRLIMNTNEITDLDFSLNESKFHCTIHEDNQATIAVAEEYRIRPRTKHINVKYWHFRQFMDKHKDLIDIKWIPTTEQVADMLTKALPAPSLHKFTQFVCGWLHPIHIMNVILFWRSLSNVVSNCHLYLSMYMV